ncbi:hypothetical protein D3C71_1859440 [compost metagenome]
MQVAQADAGLVRRLHGAEFRGWIACNKIAHQLAGGTVVAAPQRIGPGFQLALKHNAGERVMLSFW